MTDEAKAALFCAAYLATYTLCLFSARLDLLVIFTAGFAGVLIASAKLEKAEKRLQRYKDDADRRGREEMDDTDISDEDEQPRIVMTRGKAS